MPEFLLELLVRDGKILPSKTMADKNDKYDENVAGSYYVDRSCIACDACCIAAPDHFKMDDDDGHAYVVVQPVGEDELEMMKEAVESCPVECIGDDG